jgi:hypothetical protein
MSDKDRLEDAKEAFKLASDAEKEQRIRSLDDLRFAKLGEQWPEQVKRQREIEGRPCLTHNRMPSFIKQVVNDARQNRPAMKFHPVGSGATRECAEILDGLARNIEYTSNAEVAYDTALDFSVSCGLGYWMIRTDYADEDTFEQDIQIERVSNPFSIYGDPHSTAADSADWNTAFVTDLLSKTEFQRRWPKADTSDFASDGRTSKDLLWFQGEQIQVAEWWCREEVPGRIFKMSDGSIMTEDELEKLKEFLQLNGVTPVGDRVVKTHKVTQYLMNGSEILETNDWKGRYIPIVPVYGEEVNVEGKRYFHSLIHFAKDPQRQYNFWRTATTELVALSPKAPFIGVVGQFATDKNWTTANSVSHAYLEADLVPGAPSLPQRQGFAGPPAGALQEALNASDDMKNIMGLHDASLGARSNETSGRAIMARQREGDVSTFNFIDNLSRGIRHSGRIIMDLIPHIYGAERVIRCIKEDGSNFSMPINQPVIPAQMSQPGMGGPMPGPMGQQMQGMPGQPGMPQGAEMGQPAPQGQPQYHPAPPGADQDPQMAGIVKVFDLSAGKYDVTVEAGPSFTTRREEAASQMMEFMRVLPNAAPLIGDLLAKNLDWPGSDEIAKRLQAMLPPQVQGQNPQMAAMQHQMQMMDGQAKQAVGQLHQQVQELTQKLSDKTQEEQIKQYDAETKRIAALADAVKDGVQLTTTAEGGLQATPLVQQGPSPDVAIESTLRAKEIALKERELAMREQEVASKVRAQDTQTLAQHVAEVQVPTQQINQQQAHHEAMVAALHHVAQSIAQRPVKKQARAVKQADGSFVLESQETPVDATMAPAPDAVQ